MSDDIVWHLLHVGGNKQHSIRVIINIVNLFEKKSLELMFWNISSKFDLKFFEYLYSILRKSQEINFSHFVTFVIHWGLQASRNSLVNTDRSEWRLCGSKLQVQPCEILCWFHTGFLEWFHWSQFCIFICRLQVASVKMNFIWSIFLSTCYCQLLLRFMHLHSQHIPQKAHFYS